MCKKKQSMCGRFVAIFMTIVLLFTVMPETVKAERKFTYTKKYRFLNITSIDALYMAIDQWYIYEECTDTKYELSILSEEDKEIGVSFPYEGEIRGHLCHKNGKMDWNFGASGPPLINTTAINSIYVTVFWFMDGEEVLDCILWKSTDIALEGYVPNPVKPGYMFDGWVDKYGSAISEEVFLRSWIYEKGDLYEREVYIYATWKPHEHQWNESEWSKDENAHWHECIAEGCPITENSEKDGYASHDFSGKTEVIKEPKCYEAGLERVYCSQEGCGAYKERAIDKLPHEYEDGWRYDKEIHYHKCKNCDACIDEENHKMSEWEIIKEATFTEDGVKERKCQICEYKEEEIIQKLSEGHIHDFSGKTEQVKEPKCYETGLEKVYCILEECGAYEERVIDKVPHKYEEIWRYDSKIHYHKCENCDACIDEESHQMSEWEIIKEATYTEDGLKERKCQTCEYKEEEIISKLSEGHIHDFSGKTEQVKEPKCYETGLEKVYCILDECGAYEERIIEKVPHKYEEAWRYDSEIHYHKCENCDACIDEETHHFTEWEIINEPTITIEGLEKRYCNDCGYEEEKVIEKLPNKHVHEYTGKEEVITEASCTLEGLKKIYCKDEQCDKFIEKVIPKAEHDYEVGWIANEEVHYHKCKNCDTHKDENVHNMVETNVVKLATEKAPGVMELECVVCRYIKYKEIPYVKDNDKEQISEDVSIPNNEVLPDNKQPSSEEQLPSDEQPSSNEQQPPFNAPETGDTRIVHIYATLAMIGGMTYLLCYFKLMDVVALQEKKEKMVDRLIKWAKSRNGFIKGISIFVIVLILLYYHFVANFVAIPSDDKNCIDI